MSCEAGTGRHRRGPLGWLLLLPIAGMLAIYGYAAMLTLHPNVDEDYTRTFLTSEFSVYPAADSWKPGGGLDYRVGSYIDFHRLDMRQWLSRVDWQRDSSPSVTLRGSMGRVFLHLTGEPDAALYRHKLTVAVVCRLGPGHASEIEVSVNGRVVGTADCGLGASTIEADLGRGSLGINRYDEIRIERSEGSVLERLATRFGLRATAVELAGLEVDEVAR